MEGGYTSAARMNKKKRKFKIIVCRMKFKEEIV